MSWKLSTNLAAHQSLQYDEYPYDDKTWELLIQLDSANVPFNINFGDAGVGYGFISPDGTKAKFLWQCM